MIKALEIVMVNLDSISELDFYNIKREYIRIYFYYYCFLE